MIGGCVDCSLDEPLQRRARQRGTAELRHERLLALAPAQLVDDVV